MEPQVPLVGLAAAPVVAGLLEVVKRALPDGERYTGFLPIVALALGVGWNLIASAATDEGVTLGSFLVGIVIGLAASGLYSQTKTVVFGK